MVFAQEENHYNHGELNWRTIETEHFLIHFHDGAERTARVIGTIAEDIYGPVTTLYQHEPDHKISFVIKDYDDYSNGAAYFYDNKIEIWAPALDFDLRGTHHWLRNVITHEFTHIIQIQSQMKFGRRFPGVYLQWLNYEEERRQDVLYGYPNTVVSYPFSGFVLPSWFAEGVAQYNRPELSYDFWDSHRDMILRSYVLDSNMLSWSEMSVFGKTSLGNESSYNAGFALTKYLSNTYGQDVIPAIAKNLSGLGIVTIDQAIEKTVGKSGETVYAEWKEFVTNDYQRRVAPILPHRVEGEEIASEGFGNFSPVFSPDNRKIAYTSNKQADYFGQSSLYVYDRATKEEKMIISGVRSSLSWSKDGSKIYYSKITHDNPNGSELSDLYSVDVASGEETRLTHGLRAMNPSLSFDGKRLCFVVSKDGTGNIMISDTLGNERQQITNNTDGEQVYLPKWSPYGSSIVFGYSVGDGQDIAAVDIRSGNQWFIVNTEADERNPYYAPDGLHIYFSSDVTGIHNIYRYVIAQQTSLQVTNVLGGAFMPNVNNKGEMTFAAYTSSGYKIRYMEKSVPGDFADKRYLDPGSVRRPPLSIDDPSLPRNQFDFQRLRAYDHRTGWTGESRPYKNVYSSVSIIPFLRIDNYNTKSSGIDFLKPGLYFLSSDMVGKFSMFGGAAINHLFERDLFVIFEYRDRLPLFHQAGWYPTLSLEVYSVSRKRTNETLTIVEQFEETTADVTYSLFEFDLFLKQHLFGPFDKLTLGFTYSQYSSALSSFLVKSSSLLVPASSETYFTGKNFSLQYEVNGVLPARTMEINPVGRRFSFRLDNEFAEFVSEDSTGASEFEATETGIKLKLLPYTIHRAEIRHTEHFALPWLTHTLSFTLRAGTIFGPELPDFFDFYAGGLVGMKGYPFYSISGNEIAALNVAYRFPLWDEIGFRLFQIHFHRLYGELHADIGNAWSGDPNIRDFKKDAGFELRLEAFSWYAYPTRIFFNGTYGLDRFTYNRRNVSATYGNEWRFYFGILFGFDFSNDIQRLRRGFDGH